MKQLTFEEMRKDRKKVLESIKTKRHSISILLDGITDPRNIGGLFRLGDAALVDCIYVYNNTDFSVTSKVKRISRSTTDLVPFKVLRNIEEIQDLKKESSLIALEYTDKSSSYSKYEPNKHTILVLGNEKRGVSEELLALCEHSIHLPMYGLNTSMNVLCAASIAVYNLLEKTT